MFVVWVEVLTARIVRYRDEFFVLSTQYITCISICENAVTRITAAIGGGPMRKFYKRMVSCLVSPEHELRRAPGLVLSRVSL